MGGKYCTTLTFRSLLIEGRTAFEVDIAKRDSQCTNVGLFGFFGSQSQENAKFQGQKLPAVDQAARLNTAAVIP